jgi:hypothetical protein
MGCNPGQDHTESPVLYLQNESLKAGILAEVGGRLVFLGTPGGRNMLKSDTALWTEPAEERIQPSPDSEFKAYNGHIIWLGPQSEWWIHQELNDARKRAKAVWPPDPYLVLTPYKVAERTINSVLLEGPPSPVSGVSLWKRYTLAGSALEIEVTLINNTNHEVSWDIWSNARFDGNTLFFVPECEEGIIRISTEDSEKSGRLDPDMVDGAFTFASNPPGAGQNSRYAKAFLHPEEGRMVAICGDKMLVMWFDFVEQEQIHPDQGFVEIYKKITTSGSGDLLELEHHSAYTTLQPGESFSLSEKWSVHDCPAGQELKDYLGFYNKMKEQQ